MVFLAACRPPGGGCSTMSSRWTRHLSTAFMATPSEACMRQLFEPLLDSFFSRHFAPDVRDRLARGMVAAAVDAHSCISERLLPTPKHVQYRFNLHTVAAGLQVCASSAAGVA